MSEYTLVKDIARTYGPKTLVYCGANRGWPIVPLGQQFQRILAFEPDPEIFEELKKLKGVIPHIELFNVACSDKAGKATLYITQNRVSTSLGESKAIDCPPGHPYGGPNGRHHPDDKSIKQVEVETVNLGEFLKSKGIDKIDRYVSDCQGSDINILKTMMDFINESRIRELQVETYSDNIELYEGLGNHFSEFKKLLTPNYHIDHLEIPRPPVNIQEKDLPDTEWEWDTFWVVNDQSKFF